MKPKLWKGFCDDLWQEVVKFTKKRREKYLIGMKNIQTNFKFYNFLVTAISKKKDFFYKV